MTAKAGNGFIRFARCVSLASRSWRSVKLCTISRRVTPRRRRWRIGELAEATGVTVRTLHHYEHTGLLAATERTEGGHRMYDRERQLVRSEAGNGFIRFARCVSLASRSWRSVKLWRGRPHSRTCCANI
ncbi:MerR family DNA-binding transcriptional regulator [Bradyrhizobium liaoningense]